MAMTIRLIDAIRRRFAFRRLSPVLAVPGWRLATEIEHDERAHGLLPRQFVVEQAPRFPLEGAKLVDALFKAHQFAVVSDLKGGAVMTWLDRFGRWHFSHEHGPAAYGSRQ